MQNILVSVNNLFILLYMLSEKLLSEMCEFTRSAGYAYIGGSFNAIMEAPNEYQLIGNVEMVISAKGKYLCWHVDPITENLTGVYDEGNGPQRLAIPKQVSMEERKAVMEGINARVCE